MCVCMRAHVSLSATVMSSAQSLILNMTIADKSVRSSKQRHHPKDGFLPSVCVHAHTRMCAYVYLCVCVFVCVCVCTCGHVLLTTFANC